MNGSEKKYSRSSLYFKDVVRKIDLVIPYENLSDDNKNEQKRKTFLEKIKGTGLETEEADECFGKFVAFSYNYFLCEFFTLTLRKPYGSFRLLSFADKRVLENEISYARSN